MDERYAGQDFTGHGLIGPGLGGGRVRRGVFVFWDSLTTFDRILRKAESGEAGTDRVGLMFCEERAHEGKANAGWQLLTSTICTAGRALVLPMPMLHSILTHMPRGTNVPAALESVSLGDRHFRDRLTRRIGHSDMVESWKADHARDAHTSGTVFSDHLHRQRSEGLSQTSYHENPEKGKLLGSRKIQLRQPRDGQNEHGDVREQFDARHAVGNRMFVDTFRLDRSIPETVHRNAREDNGHGEAKPPGQHHTS